jgi:hypothetical protein
VKERADSIPELLPGTPWLPRLERLLAEHIQARDEFRKLR